MSGIEWTQDELSKLGRVFLRNVIRHLRGDDQSEVRFGETGRGIRPNYQVTFRNGVVRTIHGSTHKSFDQAEEFDQGRISKPFNLAHIQAAYDAA